MINEPLDMENAYRGIINLLLSCHIPGTHCKLATEAHAILTQLADRQKEMKEELKAAEEKQAELKAIPYAEENNIEPPTLAVLPEVIVEDGV